ncbi:FG-GAP repeat domain-containing protein [Synechocystis salina]|uniref:VCBS repeat-containing protein n=1 Tax=Synechocystis salina LEGE 00031 TaxID=1828736 RepID=A0ABR9VV72_9SYNC|nr:VCBS repeat-containing protein [Synechocystis salina]MBE9241970.1 VCBS repeat-containing protein [Synechocystis salina LEGE 00041]MBE9255249.1 VCBS repeat-containing protein [Synechocystis salina LEGE 00031]
MTVINPLLADVFGLSLARLQAFAQLNNSEMLLQQVFGEGVDTTLLLDAWRNETFSSLPAIELVDSAQINGALGAFARTNRTIYLSHELLQLANTSLLLAVFLEEYGHYLDSLLNAVDTPGDEGEHFAAVVLGQELSSDDLARIRAEDDKAVVIINGEIQEIEQYSFSISQITRNDTNDFDVRISGNNIAWDGAGGVYLYNGSTTRLLSSIGRDPEVSGNNVVWQENDSLLLFNGFRTVRVPDSNNSNNHNISGSNVTWRQGTSSNRRIFFYDGFITRDITPDNTSFNGGNGSNGLPNISGNNVVWTAQPSGTSNDEVYRYNGISTQRITNNRVSEFSPAVSGNNIVWREGSSLIFYNGSSTTTIATGVSSLNYLQIDGNNAVWQEGSNGSNGTSVYLYNGSTITRLTGHSRIDQIPNLSGGQVVWQSWDGNDYEIMYYDGSRSFQITNNNVNDIEPVISGSNIAWRGWDGADYEIFQAKLPPTLFGIAHQGWRNSNEGWLVKGGVLDGTFTLPSWQGWKPITTGDFNRDGQLDIVVTQPSTGYNALWVMNQGQVSWVAGLPSWGTDWVIQDTGDFNGNGNTDILVSNPSNGWNAIWDMYGITYGGYTSASFWPRWEAMAAGDMNGDGNVDVLVRNIDFGWNAVHLMGGNGQLLSTEILPSWGPDWRITGTADVNGDGKTDILATYPSQNWNVAWIMNGTQYVFHQNMPSAAGTELVI